MKGCGITVAPKGKDHEEGGNRIAPLIFFAGVAADLPEGRSSPWLSLHDGFDLPVEHVYGEGGPAGAQPTALVADDFDSDGMPDLVTGHAQGTAGVLVLQRGNPASTQPDPG